MAFHYPSSLMTIAQVAVLFSVLPFSQLTFVSSFEYQVGDIHGWTVPPPNDTQFYINWASHKRFIPGDTLHFKYQKDSVMEATEQDYKECNSTSPNLFSNNGNTIFNLDRSGSFYFISGASGHCERGQRMIVKVLAQDQDDEATSTGGGVRAHEAILFQVILQFVFQYLTSHFI